MQTMLADSIRERYKQVISRVDAASARSGQGRKVRLVVVTKAQPLEVVQSAIAAGITVLGENYAEEAVGKMDLLGRSPLEWHMIGHVQSRKADLVAANFDMLHSLDSLKLGKRLEHFCQESGRTLPVLLEVNASGEQSKYGFPAWEETEWDRLLPDFESLTGCPHLNIRGLMSMAPYFDDPERTRPFFRRVKRLQGYLLKHLPKINWTDISMGTSIDYEAAVEEGATMVRIGQAILGARLNKMEVK
jgi:pyridoxal phosphate enzyme (YggS family)